MSTYSEYLDFLSHADNDARQQINSQMDVLRSEIGGQKKLLAKLQQERDSFSAELVKVKKELEAKLDELNIKAVEIDTLQKTQKQKDAESLKRLNELKTQAAKKLTDESLRLQDLQTKERERLQTEHQHKEEALTQQIDSLTQEKVLLDGQLADERLKRSKQSAKYVDLEREYEKVCLEKVDNEEKLSHLESSYQSVKAQLEAAQSHTDESQQQLKQYKQELSQLRQLMEDDRQNRRKTLLKTFGYGASSICVLWFIVGLIGHGSSNKHQQPEQTQTSSQITYVEDTLIRGHKVSGYFQEGKLFYGTSEHDGNGTYTGTFEDDLPNGVGIVTYGQSSKSYVGQFVDGKKQGYGIYRNGNTQQMGEFRDDKFIPTPPILSQAQKDLERAHEAYNKQDYALAAALYANSDVQAIMTRSNIFHMGYMTNNGKGVPRNPEAAIHWYTVAAELGLTVAQTNLALMYNNGTGTPMGKQDFQTAFKWYLKAAIQENGSAQYQVAKCYEEGRGVAKDIHSAISWYEKAAKNNITGAKERAEKLKNQK